MKTIIAFMLLLVTSYGYSQQARLTPLKATLLSEITVNPAALDFDTTQVKQSTTLQIVVKNTGFGVLAVTNILSDNPVFIATPDSFSLANNQEQVVDIIFTPDEAISYYSNLTILNDSPTPSVEVICTGTGKWPLGVNPLERSERPYTLYPNPFSDQLNLLINLQKSTHISIVISDMTGKKIADRKIGTFQPGDQGVDLSGQLQHLPSGTYLLYIRIGANSYLEKLIKH